MFAPQLLKEENKISPSLLMNKLLLLLHALVYCLCFCQSTTLDTFPTPKNIFLCSGVGSASHVRPLLEYGLALKRKGHRVTLGMLKEYDEMAKPYKLDTFHVADEPNPFYSTRMEEWMRLGFGIRPLVKVAMEVSAPFDAFVYKGLERWFRNQKSQQQLPDIVVGDLAAMPCFEFAREYNVTALVSAHFLGFGGESF
jgi:hypothetical protein